MTGESKPITREDLDLYFHSKLLEHESREFEDLEKKERNFRKDVSEVEGMLHKVIESLARIEYAFPDGPERHRVAHEAMIKAAQAQEEFWNDLKLEIAKKGMWSLLVTILGLVVVGISANIGIVLKH